MGIVVCVGLGILVRITVSVRRGVGETGAGAQFPIMNVKSINEMMCLFMLFFCNLSIAFLKLQIISEKWQHSPCEKWHFL